MHIKYLGFTFACIMLQSYTTLASIIVPYIKPMLLGRTFDYSKSKVGNDIFPSSVRNNPVKTNNYKTDIKYRIIRSAKDVRKVLDISGQLSLQVMAGLLDIKGKGSYLKESSESGNFVEVMARVSFDTITETITDEMKPISGWDKRAIVGKHYVRSITYGGFLIASLKFHAKNEKNRENIEASVDANLKIGILDVGIQGQFKKLASSVKDISTLKISYTATAPLITVPTDIDSLLKAITDFPAAVKTVKGGIGVPIEAEIVGLSRLSDNSKLKFLIDGVLKTKLANVESFYYDLRTTSDAIQKFLKRNPLLSKDDEKKIGVFYNNIFKITETFNTLIASIDLNTFDTKSANKYKKAFDAYRNGGIILPNKFLREYNVLIATIIPIKPIPSVPKLLAYFKGKELYLKANKTWTAVAKEKKLMSLFDRLQNELNSSVTQLKQRIETYRVPVNVAIGKQAAQCSTRHRGYARLAVDGNVKTNWNSLSCTHTKATNSPWWRVDLYKTYPVRYLKITNRGDCCSDRLSGFEIRIGNSLANNGNDNPKCGGRYSLHSAETRKIVCPSPVIGRYVNIIIPGSNKILTLCEVQVFA